MNAHLMRRYQRGFSLVELMVSVVIGLLALLFATRLVVSGEQNKESAVGGSDSMQNGMLALFSLSGDATESGWGMNDPMLAGCDTVFSDANGYQLATAQRSGGSITPLSPVLIQSNGGNPDQVSFYSGTSQSGVGSVKLFANYVAGAGYATVDSKAPYGFATGDVLVIAPMTPGQQCTLFQFSGLSLPPLNNQVLITSGGANRFNPASGLAQNYAANQSYIYDLGAPDKLHFHTWSVKNGILLLRASDLPGAEAAGVSVVDNVVSIKAEYGFDTRVVAGTYDPNPAGNNMTTGVGTSGMQITKWSATMIDADGDGLVGGATDYQRIAAVRLAVVARSKTVEKPNKFGTCTATGVMPTVFGTNSPANVAAAPIQVNVAVAGDAISWQCYRYRVFETIVQIRNSQWRPG